MERSRDFRRASVSGVNGLVRRRQRITSFRDSTDEDRPMELKETARLRDRDRLQKKDRDREFSKRRRVDKSVAHQRSGGGGDSYRGNDSTDSSEGEDYFEEDEEIKVHHHKGTNQLSPTSSSLSNSRRGLRTLRSSPVFRFPSDEILGVPVPRRTRSASAKTLQKCWISGSIKFGEDLSHRTFSPVTGSSIGFAGDSPSSSGASMKKKMKSAEPRNRVLSSSSNSKPSAIQEDIEIEVAEALFDLMKQSQSSQIQEKTDRDCPEIADCELQRNENNAFSVLQNSEPKEADAETIIVDSMKDLKKKRRAEKEKFPDDPADKLVGGDVFVNKVTLGSRKENESPSCVKVNACDIKDPTVTKAEHAAAAVVEAMEVKLDIDLMAPLPSSPEKGKDAVVDIEINPKAFGQKKGETISPDATRLHPESQKEQKIQLSSSFFPFPIGMGSWPGYPPHPSCMPHLQTSLPIDASARPSMTMRPPQFKFSQPRPKRCTTHQYIAQSIDHHQQLIKKSLSESAGPATSYGTESLNSKTMFPTQMFTSGTQLETILGGRGKDKSLGGGAAFSATTSANPLLQKSSNQGTAKNLVHGPGYMLPLGSHHTSMMVPASSSGPPQSASAVGSATLTQNPAGKPPTNLSIPGGAAAVSFNHHSVFPSNGTSPYMAILQNNSGGPIPISTNIPMPTFKGGSPMPLFNTSPYSSSVFNTNNQQQQQFSPVGTLSGSSSRKKPECQQLIGTENKIPASAGTHPMIQPIWPPYSSGKSESDISGKNSTSVTDGRVKSSNLSGSLPVQPMNFAVIPPLSIGGTSGVGNKNGDLSQQGSKGRVELMPSAFALSFGTNPSTNPPANFSSMLQQNPAVFQMLPDMVTQQKNFQQSEVKFPSSGDHSYNFLKSEGAEKSASSTMATSSKFDSLRRTVNYLPSGNQSGLSPTIPNFQQLHHQQQLTQLQQHHAHQMQQQLTGATAQMKASAGSFQGSSFPTNSPVFTAQSDAAKWMNFPKNTPSEGSSQPTTSGIQKNSHITFGNSCSTVSGASLQGQHAMLKGQGESSLKGMAPSSQETSQKSTPACRRNIPSILSTCPSQLSELKY